MSNDVLKDSFFGDKEISAGEKVSLCALALGGTYSERTTEDGRNTVLFSMVYKRGGMATPVGMTFGNPTSLTTMACDALWHHLSLDKTVGPMDKAFNGEYPDREVFSKIAEAVKLDCNLSEAGLNGKLSSVRLNCNKYLETERRFNSAVTPERVNSVLTALEEGYQGKKNEMKSNSSRAI